MSQNRYQTEHLTGKRLKGVKALLTTDSIEDAAKTAGVTRNTLYRWLKEEIFTKELSKAKRQMVQYSILKLQRSTKDAVQALSEICRDKDGTASARVAAAREILATSLKAIEIEELEARIEKLEQKIKKER